MMSSRIRSNVRSRALAIATVPSPRHLDVVTLETQVVFERERDAGFVFDDEDARHVRYASDPSAADGMAVSVIAADRAAAAP